MGTYDTPGGAPRHDPSAGFGDPSELQEKVWAALEDADAPESLCRRVDELIGDWETAREHGEESSQVDVHRYARDLAVTMAERFYPGVPQFRPLDTMAGLLSQIDNMLSGIIASGAVTADALSDHWLWQMICDHDAKTDVAVCCCGLWRSAPLPSVGDAARAWASHALSAAAQVAPSSEAQPLSPSEASTGTLPPAEPLDHLSGEGSRESGE